MAASSNDILSWTNKDPRESQLYNSFGVAYRFQVRSPFDACEVARRLTASQTNVSANSNSVTVLWRTIRANKEDRVAKLEWSATGGLGRIIIGKVCSGALSAPIHALTLR